MNNFCTAGTTLQLRGEIKQAHLERVMRRVVVEVVLQILLILPLGPQRHAYIAHILTLNSVTNVTCIPWSFPSGLFCFPPRAERMYVSPSSLHTFGRSRNAAVSVLSPSSEPHLNETAQSQHESVCGRINQLTYVYDGHD